MKDWRGEAVSTQLGPLLHAAYESIISRPYDPATVADRVDALLAFLCSPIGRTNANCHAVDYFFLIRDGWNGTWEDEPEGLADVLGDLGGALHDTVSAPEIAVNFDSTPEQILTKLRVWRTEYDGRSIGRRRTD